MLNIKIIGISYEDKKIFNFFLFFLLLFFIVLDSLLGFSEYLLLLKEDLFSLNIISGLNFNFLNYDSFNNIDVFGQVLYNYFLVCFLIIGIILLIGLIGAIILTSKFKSKNKRVIQQLSRKDAFLSFF
jgi:ABC-type sugar transport system permease subunit